MTIRDISYPLFQLLLVLSLSITCLAHANETPTQAKSIIVLETTKGMIEIELFDKKAPLTVENFLGYVDSGFYSDTLFHRVIPGFMVQAGGFTEGMVQKQTSAPIKNEAQSFIPNKRGSIAMARTSAPHSATSQFFINVANNHFLNKSASQAGYAVFGQVISGMDVVEAIEQSPTGKRGHFGDVPVNDIKIISIKRK